MKPQQTHSVQSRTGSRPFEFQNWPVYREMLLMSRQFDEIGEKLPERGRRSLGDQLVRAGQSVCLNIAEGCARTTSKDKANFFRMAKGSLFECVAALDLLAEQGVLQVRVRDELQLRLVPAGKMLSGLIRYIEKED